MRTDRFDAFSTLLLDIYRASAEESLERFQDAALDIIKPWLPFTGAMWGTATFVEGVGIDIHSLHLHNQSPEMILEYEDVKHLDTSAALVSSTPSITQGFHSPSWFDGGATWDDYRDWQRRHGHENVFITAATDSRTGATQWFSLFREDADQLCRTEEVQLLSQLSPHLMQGLRHNYARHVNTTPLLPDGKRFEAAIADARGVIHYATPGCEAMLHAEFGMTNPGSRIPAVLMESVSSECKPFVGRTLVAIPKVRKDLLMMRFRPLRAADSLAPRQREAAELVAQGFTHKQAAQRLGRSPATVRNQMQEVYRKLNVQNVAALAQALAQE